MVADQRNELNSDIDSYYKDYLEKANQKNLIIG